MRLIQLLRTFIMRPTLPMQSRFFQHDFVPIPAGQKPKKYKYPDFYDPYGPRPPPSDKIIKLADRITQLSDEERGQLRATFRACLELPEAVIFKSGGGVKSEGESGEQKGEEKKAEKTMFDVKLEKFEAASKLKVVKEVRELTKLGLKESKELVEKAPCVVKSGVTKEEGESIIEKMKAAGGVAVIE